MAWSLAGRASFLLGLATLLSCPEPAGGGEKTAPVLTGDLRVHDPSSIVRCGDEYWLFATGPRIVSRRSKDLVTWRAGPRVLTKLPSWHQQIVPGHRGYLWAPDVIRLKGGYYLYYSVSAWGKNTSAIGLATNPTLDPTDPAYLWTDQGVVVRSEAKDNFNAIDPSVMLDAQGKLWLGLGSFWSGLKLVQLDPAAGRPLTPDSPLQPLACHRAIEAPCLYRHGDWYYLFVNWGFCCRGTNSTYQIRLGRSPTVTGPYLDRQGLDLLQEGGTLFLDTSGPLIGPGHAGILAEGETNWLSFHYYDGQRAGQATLGLRQLRWSADGWPSVEAKGGKASN
jgi:arabinan endo-1,5-alpha-L-arabinosidase